MDTYRESPDNVPYNLKLPSGYMADGVSFMLRARLRQLRIAENSCTAAEELKHYFQSCYSSYNTWEQDEGAYQIGWNESLNGGAPAPEFKYKSALELYGNPVELKTATYSGGGYIAQLGRDRVKAFNLTSYLENANWIDIRTRAVFVESLAYNPNTQLYTVVTIGIEFYPGGGTLLTSKIKSMKLDKYTGSNGKLLLVLQAINLLFIIYFIYRQVKDMLIEKSAYFKVIF